MASKDRRGAQGRRLPKDALTRVSLGQSFAEYDRLIIRPGVFVETPAYKAATDESRSKCFFVGRRGTGKTAITRMLQYRRQRDCISILPQSFLPLVDQIGSIDFSDPNRQPFRTLVASFERAMIGAALQAWSDIKVSPTRSDDQIVRDEVVHVREVDFDLRVISLVEEGLAHLRNGDQRSWMRDIKTVEKLVARLNELQLAGNRKFVLLIDRLDESWDGSDQAVTLLMALMRACVNLDSGSFFVRPLLFVRENIFERVRAIDSEFARLETCVVSMDWTRPLLTEMVERRLNLSQTTKLSLGGETWDYFFEDIDDTTAREYILEFCQERPRDVLTFCSLAIESAQGRRVERVQEEDILSARRKFSESRLKDLGDEYAENFPQIKIVLSRMYGLGNEFTVNGVEDLVRKIISDREVADLCGGWIYSYSDRDRFIRLMYDIGFWGVKNGSGVSFRSSGSRLPSLPPITRGSSVVVHPSYTDALNLRPMIIGGLGDDDALQTTGMLSDLPGSINQEEYVEALKVLSERINALPKGIDTAPEWEECVGEVIKYCFYRSLSNVEPLVRDVDGRVVRDWIAANRAISGFWEMVRNRYGATQVVWECKNFSDLGAAAFQQCSYYMNDEIGRFVVLCYRGEEMKKPYYEHIRRIANNHKGLILLLNDRDLQVFIRQAMNGKIKEDHIQNRFDGIVRKVS